MKITFNGAAKTVTGSQHLLEVNGKKILLDCGMYQGKRKDAYETNRKGVCDYAGVDMIVLSHAHIDHSGSIPCAVKNGFRGDIYATAATRDLCAIMLLDSGNIQERDVEYVNKQRKKEGKKLFEPLYTAEDAAASLEHFVAVGYRRPRRIAPGVDLTFVDAGHLLGSAHVVLDIEEDKKGKRRLVFSGDIGRPGIPIIRDPEPVSEGADVLIMESTYGGRVHDPYPKMQEELARIVNGTFAKGGTILIPAFAVGRTQQIVYELHKLFDAGAIPNLPIYVDSPMATRVTEVYRYHPEVYDREVRDFIMEDDHANPFGFGRLRFTPSVAQSMELNDKREPMIIIASSGMLEGGRILHHLRRRIFDEKNTVVITGWQAPETLGRRVVERREKISIYGKTYKLNAAVEVLTGFSGHADGPGLTAWADAMKKKPSHTFVVHGEEEAAGIVAQDLEGAGFGAVAIPERGESHEV